MIISFSGDIGSGKSTIAQKLAETLNFRRVYIGQLLRDLAQKKKMTIVEYMQYGETHPEVDKEVDDYLIKIANSDENLILESRTAWFLVLNSLKIYLAVAEEEGARRIFSHLQQENLRNEDKQLQSVTAVLASNQKRKNSDNKRYQQYYGINIYDKNNYDFVLDTTELSIDEVFNKTLEFIKSKM